ncbi:hypothetical protein ACFL3T_00555 [Patescibacteria group bacterium]
MGGYNPFEDPHSMHNPDTCNGEARRPETKIAATKVDGEVAAAKAKINRIAGAFGAEPRKQVGPKTKSDDGVIDRGMFGTITDQIRLVDDDELE